MPKKLFKREDEKVAITARVHPKIKERLKTYVEFRPDTMSSFTETAIAYHLNTLEEWAKIDSKKRPQCPREECIYYRAYYKKKEQSI